MLGTALLTACAAHAAQAQASIPSAELAHLVRSNPLYAELVHYDRAIAALRRTEAVWGARERATAIALSRAAAASSFAQASQLLSGDGALARIEAARESGALEALAVPSYNATNAARYGADLSSEARQAIEQTRRAFESRIGAAYAQRRAQLAEKESALALSLTRQDAVRVMLLRIKIEDLGVDAATRAAAASRLRAIERRDAAHVATLRARNAATLAAYRAQFARETSLEEASTIAQIERRFAANLAARAAPAPEPSAELRNDIDALRGSQPAALGEARGALVAFGRAHSSVATRLSTLAAIDAAAASSAASEIAQLQVERRQLYDALVTWAQSAASSTRIRHQSAAAFKSVKSAAIQ